jgi:hypothetical protein
MNDTIDLGDDLDDPSVPQPESPNSSEPYYPEVSLSHPSLVGFPNTGKSVIEHKVVSRTHELDEKGRPHHRIRLKIKSIRAMGRKKNSGAHTTAAESAMRGLMDESQ